MPFCLQICLHAIEGGEFSVGSSSPGTAPAAESSCKECFWYVQMDPHLGNFLVVQWLGLHPSTAGGMGSIPGQGTKILQAAKTRNKTKQKNQTKTNKKQMDPHLCLLSPISSWLAISLVPPKCHVLLNPPIGPVWYTQSHPFYRCGN